MEHQVIGMHLTGHCDAKTCNCARSLGFNKVHKGNYEATTYEVERRECDVKKTQMDC